MQTNPSFELQAKERSLIDAVRQNNPERLTRPNPPDPDLVLGRIGVTWLSPDRPRGYLRLYPHDFLVEEILPNGELVSLLAEKKFQTSEDQRTLWVDLIKAGISGPHAINDLQLGLDLAPGKIGYGGMKDAMAVTAQRLSLREIAKVKVDQFKHERMFLRPVCYGCGAIQPGDLAGNRFTIVVRGNSQMSVDENVRSVEHKGFLNFFGAQRFGNRLLAHLMGQKMLQNDIDGLLRIFFGQPGLFDVPLYRDMRLAMAESYGDWDTMLKIAEHFPFSLRDETTVLRALAADPKKTRGALALIKNQAKLWAYAYASWLVNRRMSEIVKSSEVVPEAIALPLRDTGPLPEYHDLMSQDGTLEYQSVLRNFPYIQMSSRMIPAVIQPQNVMRRIIDQGWVLRFSLNKGAYATSCLSHVFRLYEGLPVPDWVPGEEVDTLAMLGEGSLAPMKEHFKNVLVRRDLTTQDAEEETA